MRDSKQVPDVQEVGARALALFQQSEKKISRLDVAVELAMKMEEVGANTVYEAIAWLFANGYITHNKSVVGWDNDDITDVGHRYLAACNHHVTNNVS